MADECAHFAVSTSRVVTRLVCLSFRFLLYDQCSKGVYLGSFSSQRPDALPSSRVLASSSPLGTLKLSSCLQGSSSFSSLSPHHKLPDSSDFEEVELDSIMPSSLEVASLDSDWAVSLLASQFPPLDFPPDLAKRILTHPSYRRGAQTYGHNTRLAFMGRRVMDAYFLMFLQSSLPESTAGPNFDGSKAAVGDTAYVDFEELAEKVLDSRSLGRYVGDPWGIGDVMRWTSAVCCFVSTSVKNVCVFLTVLS